MVKPVVPGATSKASASPTACSPSSCTGPAVTAGCTGWAQGGSGRGSGFTAGPATSPAAITGVPGGRQAPEGSEVAQRRDTQTRPAWQSAARAQGSPPPPVGGETRRSKEGFPHAAAVVATSATARARAEGTGRW